MTAGIADWIADTVPVEIFVPEEHAAWRPLIRDAFQFIFSHLSQERFAPKIAEQMQLPATTPPEKRLIRLISKMPGLQKMGQVLARNRRLAPALRDALTELENGMCDVSAEEIRSVIEEQLGTRIHEFGVSMEPAIYKEGTASAILRFTWRHPHRERERGAFKVLKPHVPRCFAEDMTLLEALARFLAGKNRGYGFAVRDLKETLTEVRLLLEHELDFRREQATLQEARGTYRSSFGIRIPRPIPPLCTGGITAMTAEDGVKVTEASRRSPIRRDRIAGQLIEALVAVPLFSREKQAVFHGDPHAGNLLYDEANRELVVLDWALADRLSIHARRYLVMLALMMLLRNPRGVAEAIRALSRRDRHGRMASSRLIENHVNRFFDALPEDVAPGVLDAMALLDQIALQGVRFPAALFLFRKSLFTLDGVLVDVAGPDIRMDRVVTNLFLARWAASLGFFHAPLEWKDFGAVGWHALRSASCARTP